MKSNTFATNSVEETIQLGKNIGGQLKGGEVIELTSDLGGGKTTFTRGLVEGFGSDDPVASPSFTINNVYRRTDGKAVWHFDFYRLSEPGIVASELAEAQADDQNIIVVEWGDIVHDVLAGDRITINIAVSGGGNDEQREITISVPEGSAYLLGGEAK